MAEDVAPELDADLLPVLAKCERRLGYAFRDKLQLRAALTHASGAEHRLASNERLEFLGDAILGAVVCELLFEITPEDKRKQLQSGVLSLDLYDMRGRLAEKGLKYV